MPFDIAKLDTLHNISNDGDNYVDVSYKQLSNWEKKGRNGFPKPKRYLGKYKLFDIDEVVEWVTLWRKVTKNMKRGAELNGKR